MDEKKAAATPPKKNYQFLLEFGQNVSWRWKLKVTKFGHRRVRDFWLAAVSLVIWASEPPPLPGPDSVKKFFKMLRGFFPK